MTPGRKRLQTEDDFKRVLAGKVGRRLREDVWAAIQDDYREAMAEVMSGIEDDQELLEMMGQKYCQLDARFPAGGEKQQEPRKPREIPADHRLAALSEILAVEAGRLPEVAAFRRDVLDGRLLSQAEAVSWIRAEADKQEPGGGWATVGLPVGADIGYSRPPLAWLDALAALPEEEKARWPVGFSIDALVYPVPGDEWAHSVAARWDGPLGHLQELAERLARRYGWQEAQATLFVLTGVIPLIPRATTSRPLFPPSSVTPAPVRITLKVDPRLSTREVASLYAKVRNEVFKGRDKPMTEKHLKAAVFLADHPDLPWAAMMEKWNQQHAEWTYDDWRRFARDVRAAWSRVTGRKWIPAAPRRTDEAAPDEA